jgi:hypothetical protein
MRAALLLLPLLLSAPCEAQTPPKKIKTKLCSIGSVFGKLLAIKNSPACRAGCAGGKCPADWMPGSADKCSAACGKVFEPFWDECGTILVASKMGGMAVMGKFYDHCLQSLYPPGTCGKFCNGHTYDCYLKEVQQSCCDEHGKNCAVGSPIPNTCPVSCSLVFPTFNDVCKDHIRAQPTLQESQFKAFSDKCLKQDALALVQYALDMRSQGCIVNLGDGVSGRRRAQNFLGQWFESNARTCSWDQIDDYAADVDRVCCPGGRCVGGRPPKTCSVGCAVAMHQFGNDCAQTLDLIMPRTDSRRINLIKFQTLCIKTADTKAILRAIANAKCPATFKHGQHHSGAVLAPPSPSCAFVTGSTVAGSTKWVSGGTGLTQEGDIFVDVDTSKFNFQTTPHYVASFLGTTAHHMTTGGSSIFRASRTGFRVWIRQQFCGHTTKKGGQTSTSALGQQAIACVKHDASWGTTAHLTPQLANARQYRIVWVAEAHDSCQGAGDSDYQPIGLQGTRWVKYCWTANECTGVYADIHLKPGFKRTPVIVAALHGSSHHTDARGANGIYSASTKGFRVYVHSTASCAQADIRMCGGVGITTADASRWGWKVHYLATENQAMSGRGDVKWVDVGEHLVRNDVHVHFHSKVNYVTSLEGSSHMWSSDGASSIYNASPNGFQIFMFHDGKGGGGSLTATRATNDHWRVNWLAVTAQ